MHPEKKGGGGVPPLPCSWHWDEHLRHGSETGAPRATRIRVVKHGPIKLDWPPRTKLVIVHGHRHPLPRKIACRSNNEKRQHRRELTTSILIGGCKRYCKPTYLDTDHGAPDVFDRSSARRNNFTTLKRLPTKGLTKGLNNYLPSPGGFPGRPSIMSRGSSKGTIGRSSNGGPSIPGPRKGGALGGVKPRAGGGPPRPPGPLAGGGGGRSRSSISRLWGGRSRSSAIPGPSRSRMGRRGGSSRREGPRSRGGG